MPTIKDVAREANVSIATVSYVLNDKSDSISEDTRQHVLQTADRIGYSPNVTARNLRFNQTRLIGYAWHEVPLDQVNPVMDYFTYHLAHAAEEEEYHVLTFTYLAHDPISDYDELIRTGRVDAFVLSQLQRDDPRISLLSERNIPFVSFGRAETHDSFPWVDVDGKKGVEIAIEYLIELGHRRIAMVSWDHQESTAKYYRMQGYLDAMQKAGLPIPEGFIFEGEQSELTGRQALAKWSELPKGEQPTAVFAISDLQAIGVMNEAEERGYVVGETLSVIGFDDVPMSQYLRPSLTTLRQPIPQIATKLMGLLSHILKNKNAQPDNILLTPTLVKRDSTGRP